MVKKQLEPIEFTIEPKPVPTSARFKITVYDDVINKVTQAKGDSFRININRSYRQLYLPLTKKIKRYNDSIDAQFRLALHRVGEEVYITKTPKK